MAKIIDITEKLNFDENPKLRIAGHELEVNGDAETMLRIMGAFSGEKGEMQAVAESINLLFSEKDREILYSIKNKAGNKLSTSDLMTVIQAAMDAVMGEDTDTQR